MPRPPKVPHGVIRWQESVPFVLVHFLPLLAIFTGISRTAVILFVTTYLVRMFFITGGYHRYFAHRTYRVGRITQFVLAFGGGTSAQKGALWWAYTHRLHHRYADTDLDPHTPRKGFWWSHVGWVLGPDNKHLDLEVIPDLAKYPELVFLTKHDAIAPWTLGIACFLIGGWSGLVVGFFASTVLLWHCTFMVNSVAHLVGRQRYRTNDTSRNNWFVALMTLGEGWHNNHHHAPNYIRQGFRWWEIDLTYYVLRLLGFLHIVTDMRLPTDKKLNSKLIGEELDVPGMDHVPVSVG